MVQLWIPQRWFRDPEAFRFSCPCSAQLDSSDVRIPQIVSDVHQTWLWAQNTSPKVGIDRYRQQKIIEGTVYSSSLWEETSFELTLRPLPRALTSLEFMHQSPLGGAKADPLQVWMILHDFAPPMKAGGNDLTTIWKFESNGNYTWVTFFFQARLHWRT